MSRSSAGAVRAAAPCAPTSLHHLWHSPGTIELSWRHDQDVSSWHVVVTQADETVADRIVGVPGAVIEGIEHDRDVHVAVSALAGGSESEPLRYLYPDFRYRPDVPRGLTVTASGTSLQLAWLQDDACEEWHLIWRRFEAAPTRTMQQELESRAPSLASGTAVVKGEPHVTVTGLEPDTEYSLLIAACWRRSTYSPTSLTVVQRTGEDHGPRTPRLRAGRITDDSIEFLWDDDEAATGWAVRRVPGHVRHQLTGQPRWQAEGLLPGTGYEFEVVALDEDHGLESKEATIRLRTTGG